MQFNFARFDFGGSGRGGPPPTVRNLMAPPASKRVIIIGAGILALIVLLVAIMVLRAIYTNWLWFEALGFLDLFKKILITRIWLFFVGLLSAALILSTSLYFAYRFSKGEIRLPIPPESIIWLKRLVKAVIVVFIAIASIIFATTLSGHWETILLFINSVPFFKADPIFDKDASFYMFSLPILHLVQGWLLGAVIVTGIGTVGVYVANATLQEIKFTVTPTLQKHLAIIISALLIVIAMGHFLDRYELLYSEQGAIYGAAYTDVHARQPALFLLTILATFAGVVVLASMFLRTLQQRIRICFGAFGLWLIAAIVAGAVFPALMQRLSVNPNELQQETPYILNNIEWTREGFDLSKVAEANFSDYQPDISTAALTDNPEIFENIRLWDPRPTRDVYNQVQHLRLYYDFIDVDVDRYKIDGEYRQVLVSARELSPERLPEEAQRWVNRTLQYTHGYGAVMSPVTRSTGEGQPDFYLKDIPPAGKVTLDKPQVYYGENTTGFVIVNSKEKEFDHPDTAVGGSGLPVYTTYQGSGGVPLSSQFRRLAYAWEFADFNILISSQLTDESRIQYHRTIQERVATIAPFIHLDDDPYIVISDGALFWIQDGYTISDRYPYSKPFNKEFNYIRNSVKVVIDAYNGSIQFFVADRTDPIIQTYAKMFPGVFLPLANMSESLQSHIRYPEGLFSVQAETYLQYHMKDPTVFFNKEDQWSVPSEVVFGSPTQVRPYFIIMKLPRLPGESQEVFDAREPEFIQILPFTPANKPNLVAWIAARSDTPNYGELVSFAFPSDRQVFGPSQIEARIDNDTEISAQFTLWGQTGSQVIRGNLLVVPLADTLMYVEPVYLQAETLALPELKQVIVATANKVVMRPTLEEGRQFLLAETRLAAGTQEETDFELELANLQEQLGQATEGSQDIDSQLSAIQLLKLRQQLSILKEELDSVGQGVSRLDAVFEELANILAANGA